MIRSRLRRIGAVLVAFGCLFPAMSSAQGPIQQAGFNHHQRGPNPWLHPTPYAPSAGGCCPETTFEYVPTDRSRALNHLRSLGEGFTSMWYRLEYLNWTIEPPGEEPLGARLANFDTEDPFPAVDPVAGGIQDFGIQPDGRLFDLKKNNGLRFTMGLPTRIGDFEASVFVLDQADSNISRSPIRRFDLVGDILDNSVPNLFPATVLNVDGSPDPNNATMILYNQNYTASLKTDMFGTGLSFVTNPVTPNQPLSFHGIVGFQYFNVRENFLISGQDIRNANDPVDPLATVTFNHRIDARAQNNVYAPEIGVRAQFTHEWFSIGVTPKFLLGFNRRTDELRTSQILDVLDSSFQQEEATEFAPGFDLKVDARVHLNEHFSIYAGYQLYVLSNISRPMGNVNYNSVGGNAAITLDDSKQHQFWFDGITVGGELRFH